MNIKSLLLLGMGSIQKALIELLNHEQHYLLQLPATCICPEDIPEYIKKIKPDIKHLKTSITENNVISLIEPLIDPSVLVIDLTVNVETIDIIVLCKKKGVMYINTSLEKYNKNENGINPEKTTLYYQELLLEEASKKDYDDNQNDNQNDNNKTPTIIHSMGMNPGAISSLVYQGIEEYCTKYHPEKMALLEQGKFNLVAEEYLDAGHISEFDNQETNLEPKKGWMINSWSAEGLVAEALSISFVSSDKPLNDYNQSEYNSRMYYSTKYKSMDCTTDSYCLYPDGTPFKYEGRMITHFEVVSLSKYLSKDAYVPFLSYVYSSSPISQKCLNIMKENNYTEPENHYVFNQKNVINKDSFDSLGATLFFRDGRIFWCGTVLTNEQTLKLLGQDTNINATQLQVAVAVLSGIEWMIANPNRGIITAEEIPYKYIIERCKPYWGNFFCKEI